MRIRIEDDAGRVADFLANNAYPYTHHWDPERLAGWAIMVRVEDATTRDIDTVGYIWATWHPSLPLTLTVHACVSHRFRGRWVRDVFDDLERLATFLGTVYLTTDTLDTRESRLIRHMLTRTCGFEMKSDGSVIKKITQ